MILNDIKAGEIVAIKLRTVYYATKEKYELKLLTGNSGLDRLFSWVHILENIDTMDYLHGNEIVITTGIGKDSDQWLEEYVKKVVNSSATALIINTGKFINQIPPDLIKYCQTKNFPLFTVPWRIHLIDIIRDYCNRIFLSEQFAFSLTESIKNAIFHPEKPAQFESQLERNSFDLNSNYAIIAIQGQNFAIQKSSTQFHEQLQLSIEIQLNAYGFVNCIFEIEDAIMIVVNDPFQLKDFAKSLDKALSNKFPSKLFEISVSDEVSSIKKLQQAYKQVKYVMDRIQKHSANSLCFFEDNGINELILAVNDFEILQKSAQRILEPILLYDRDNGTDYTSLLKLYLQENGSIKAISAKTFTHRNTINYRIKKIKEILSLNLEVNRDRFKLMLAFYILDSL